MNASSTEPLPPWWKKVHDTAQLLASQLNAAVGQASRDGVYTPPPGSPPPRRRRQAASLRHLAEVIRTHRLAPGMSVDKDDIAAVLAGDPRRITDPVLVIAVARAAHQIADLPFTDDDADRLRVASAHVAALTDVARQADEKAPRTVPARLKPVEPPVIDAYFTTRRPRRRWPLVATASGSVLLAGIGTFLVLGDRKSEKPSPPSATETRPAPVAADAECRLGATDDDIIANTPALFDDDRATRLSPTLDFDQMNGSARYARHDGRTYYWGRAGSDDQDPHAGGARIRWSTPDGRWRSCASALATTERGYVHTPAVATTIGGQPITVQICLWRDEPRRENCTQQISNGR
ncbi:hypothetical protein ACWT_3978 [Actinoplanes sp. SE50]|uniref:hypothetical protein n=1 Tax=unclassified Actinoplanes TaxID=2626549 RepID=UPI00023ED45E|nr:MULTISPECIES: hypothetical protein [unclassified Actinoplanes]AEV85002.1 hypothetical protein ACPL_4107 [Actinoplanes sp. SE50/110]ATO83393.1 hypothetical protein ACWT_3978 [Actinoplanes sp. SE50]SLM00800.1 hypothetical protein ACSP50_4033 [Actinoplanes sp. SE50/110]